MDATLPGISDTEKNMLDAGVSIDEPAFEDYFGFSDVKQWYFPDGKQYVEFQIMNDGARSRYQEKTSSDVRLFKTTGDASIKVNPAQERTILFEESVTGWMIMRKTNDGDYEQVPFDRPEAGKNAKPKPGGPFDQWRQKANPVLVADLEAAIRKANPWLRNELTVEAIDDQIKELGEMRVEAVKREEGK